MSNVANGITKDGPWVGYAGPGSAFYQGKHLAEQGRSRSLKDMLIWIEDSIIASAREIATSFVDEERTGKAQYCMGLIHAAMVLRAADHEQIAYWDAIVCNALMFRRHPDE